VRAGSDGGFAVRRHRVPIPVGAPFRARFRGGPFLHSTPRFLSLALCAALALSLGCATTKPQNLRLDPPVQVARSNAGQGKTLSLQIKDTRPRKTLGIVGDLSGRYAHVSIEDDISSTLYQNVSAGLRELGFRVQPTPAADQRALVVEVREIDYESLKKGLGYDTQAKVAIAALGQAPDERYERLYSAGETKTAPFPPNAEDNTRAVNTLVSTALQDMLADDKLIAVLAR
jgi:uncharacterized lipoprotein YajG